MMLQSFDIKRLNASNNEPAPQKPGQRLKGKYWRITMFLVDVNLLRPATAWGTLELSAAGKCGSRASTSCPAVASNSFDLPIMS